jgi:hypothetical protein
MIETTRPSPLQYFRDSFQKKISTTGSINNQHINMSATEEERMNALSISESSDADKTGNQESPEQSPKIEEPSPKIEVTTSSPRQTEPDGFNLTEERRKAKKGRGLFGGKTKTEKQVSINGENRVNIAYRFLIFFSVQLGGRDIQ